MKNLILTATFCFLTVASLMAQRDRTVFSSLNMSGAWGGNQVQFTELNGEFNALAGGFGGVEFNKNLFVGGGAFTSTTNRFVQSNNTNEMSYGGVMIGYGVKSHKVIHPQATLLAGAGWVQPEGGEQVTAFVAQPAIGLEINVLRWFRVGVHGGYRIAMDNSFSVDNQFSDAYGSVSFKFGWSWGR